MKRVAEIPGKSRSAAAAVGATGSKNRRVMRLDGWEIVALSSSTSQFVAQTNVKVM